MMRSMYSAIAGLKAHQTKMDVIGNNIANVNTTGFKSSSVTFSDVYYQTIQKATGANETTGTAGQNAQQIGLGSSVSAINTSITSQGSAQSTGNPFDIMINGDAFFIVNQGGTNYFTKDGSFNVDASGFLCTSSGAQIMGWQVDPTNPSQIIQDTVSPLQIMSAQNQSAPPEATKNGYVTGNIDQTDKTTIEKGSVATMSFFDQLGNSYTLKLNVKQASDADGQITNQYAVSVTDILDGDSNSIFAKRQIGTDGNPAVDTDGKPLYEATETTFSFGGVDYDIVVATDGTVTCTPDEDVNLVFNGVTGKFQGIGSGDDPTATDVTLSISTGDGNANPFSDISIDFSTITMFASTSGTSLEGQKGDLEGNNTGRTAGTLSGISIDNSGKIYGTYDNGTNVLLGQVAVASFANPSGLEAIGGNLFAETQNSGSFDGIGQDPTANGNSLTTGYLESSNVDLAKEFTEMITTQRGYQANSRIITTADTLLEELINLKR